jgi:hypothetical protein
MDEQYSIFPYNVSIEHNTNISGNLNVLGNSNFTGPVSSSNISSQFITCITGAFVELIVSDATITNELTVNDIATFSNGASNTPSVTFANNLGSGLYVDKTNSLGISYNGSPSILFNSPGSVQFYGSGGQLQQWNFCDQTTVFSGGTPIEVCQIQFAGDVCNILIDVKVIANLSDHSTNKIIASYNILTNGLGSVVSTLLYSLYQTLNIFNIVTGTNIWSITINPDAVLSQNVSTSIIASAPAQDMINILSISI